MTNSYKKESNSKHKKLLVPVIALLLCVTAMTGVGYAALMSDVSNTDNSISMNGLVLNLTGAGGSADAGKISNNAVIGFKTTTLNGVTTYTIVPIDATGEVGGTPGLVGQGIMTINAAKACTVNITKSITATSPSTIPAGVTMSLVISNAGDTDITDLEDITLTAGVNTFQVKVIVALGSGFVPATAGTGFNYTVLIAADVKSTP